MLANTPWSILSVMHCGKPAELFDAAPLKDPRAELRFESDRLLRGDEFMLADVADGSIAGSRSE